MTKAATGAGRFRGGVYHPAAMKTVPPTLPPTALLIALALSAPAALAAPRPVALAFEDTTAEPACADEAALRARVVGLVDGPAFDADARRRATVRISADGGRRLARVKVLEGQRVLGDRQIETVRGDCPALLASVALSLVLVIDPVRGVALMGAPPPPLPPSAPPPSAPPRPSPAAPPDPDPPAAQPPAASPRRASATRLDLEAALVTTVGATPGFGGGWSLAGGLYRAGWSVAIEARLQPPSTVAHGGGRVRAALIAGGLRGCGQRGIFELCALARVGLQPVSGRGFDRDATSTAEVAFAGGRLGLRVPLLQGWAIVGGLELAAPLGTTALRVDGRTAWQSPPVVGAALLGAARRFP